MDTVVVVLVLLILGLLTFACTVVPEEYDVVDLPPEEDWMPADESQVSEPKQEG